MEKIMDVSNVMGGLTASSVLTEVSISQWVGRKIDKGNTRKVVHDNGARSSDAALVTKKLFVGNALLEEVSRQASRVRAYVAAQTLPWMGDLRLLPMSNFLRFQSDMHEMEDDFNEAVANFLRDYNIHVSGMAFQLGALFDRSEYPTTDELKNKFKMSWTISPLPAAGDFRVDAENELRRELALAYEKAAGQRIAEAMGIMWEKLRECLEHMKDRLTDRDDGKPQIFRDSMRTNAEELVGLLAVLNVANDPKLDEARRDLKRALSGVEAEDLRKNEAVRADVRAAVTDMLDKYKVQF